MSNDQALIVIDAQNDYFPGGLYPQWNTDAVLENIVAAVGRATSEGSPVILVQHVADAKAPLFRPGSQGVALHPRVTAAAPGAPVVVKTRADAFLRTTLAEELRRLGVTKLLICGMMTQNCVTHTALSQAADNYRVSVLAAACTSVDPMVHAFALDALSDRVALL